MNSHIRSIFPVVAAALAVALLGASSVPTLPVPKGAAMIFNPGNGDYSGFRIVVTPNGHATAVDGAGRASNDLQPDLAQRFFEDLTVAAPAGKDASKQCSTTSESPTNAEVNAAIAIVWNDRRWNDLRCATDSRAARLADDAAAIERTLYVQAYRQRMMYVYVGNNGTYVSTTITGQTYGQVSGSSGYGVSSPGLSFGGYGTSPYSSYPSGSMPTTSLPGASIPGGLPTSSLPYSTPYTGLPTSGLPTSGLPYSSPYGSSPYSGF